MRKVELAFERALFLSRWMMAPMYAGLAISLALLVYVFASEVWHLFANIADLTTNDVILGVLALIDLSLAANLVLIVIFSGYENFVSTIDAKGTDSLGWLGKMDSGTLKLKVAASIVAISSIYLLRIFMQVRDKGENALTNDQIMWYVILHMTFVLSAVLLGVLDKMSFSKHREH
jgi:uncharacterized protein (TIGR00645 family)